jgi:hypothetical protein
MELCADGELAQALRAQVPGEAQSVPHGLLDRSAAFTRDRAGHPEPRLGFALHQRDAVATCADDRRQLRMDEPPSHRKLGIRRLTVAVIPRA